MRWFFISLLFVPGYMASAEVQETANVLDAGGGVSSNATYTNTGAIGQGGPVGSNASAINRNHSGFLNAFVLHPQLDLDQDGIADENDPDDDNDGLGDTAELAGGGSPVVITDPLKADSDDDGSKDGAELAAGTDPLSDLSRLRIIEIRLESGQAVLCWKSRTGKSYRLLRGVDPQNLKDNPVDLGTIIAGPGGVSPWFETETESPDPAPPSPTAVYRIEVVAP